MSAEYQINHYVPKWYQKRFLPSGQTNNELYYLDLDGAGAQTILIFDIMPHTRSSRCR